MFELVEEIEGAFAGALEPGRFDELRATLLQLANRVDPDGNFGPQDEPPFAKIRKARTSQENLKRR